MSVIFYKQESFFSYLDWLDWLLSSLASIIADYAVSGYYTQLIVDHTAICVHFLLFYLLIKQYISPELLYKVLINISLWLVAQVGKVLY